MSSLAKTYDPSKVEEKWYDYWLKNDLFSSKPDDREAYTIVIPPPNVTGQLHLGHTLNNTLQDALIRKARLEGKNACWVPGTDHASIATENKVLDLLAEQGIKKEDLTRDEFLKHAWDWTDKYGGIILKQLRKLGASCDWDRTAFTMDKNLHDSVIKVFVDLFNKGYIYRGARMVNWDPMRKTALSDEEVYHTEENSRLFHIKYQIAGSNECLTIATTRPETLLGDTAICVHPEDERYAHLKGAKAIVPLVNREVPIIFDEYVDMEFGTGALKVTPAHDINDYNLGAKHDLESIEILNDDGTLSEAAQVYVGVDRFEARKKIAKELEENGQLEKIEDIRNKVARSERSKVVIEPKLSTQWFCKMEDIAKPALDQVLDNTIEFFPKNAVNTYKHWLENINDWCVSRQLWWGQQIPAYFYGKGQNDFVVAETIEEALKLAQEKTGNAELNVEDLTQETDVVDTWFSSWLWPMTVFNGILEPENEEYKYYYPTNVLVTGQDIIFFWVARMIMAGLEYENQYPFKDVYFTGLVRDEKRRKMSKSLGNSPDLFETFEKYSADGVRLGVLLCAPAGNDLLYKHDLSEQGRNFANKVWNALRLVDGWKVDESLDQSDLKPAIDWFEAKLRTAVEKVNHAYSKYRLSEAAMEIYKLIWDDFCSWYLEMIKPGFEQPISRKIYDATMNFFDELMVLLHPMMPFITEEIWQNVKERKDGESIMTASWPTFEGQNPDLIGFGEKMQGLVSGIRNLRSQQGMSPKDAVEVYIASQDKGYETYKGLISKLANVSKLEYTAEKVSGAKSFIIGTDEIFVPVEIDTEKEKEEMQKELDRQRGFLKGVEKKLSNERFVNNAPDAVVASEKKKQADALARIEILEKSLAELS
ncbi:MAG: valine--tRNA ligase [Flavobacteriales bacterium]|nr:valine--tRNA ligase [Flavobacteriales bacterium]